MTYPVDEASVRAEAARQFEFMRTHEARYEKLAPQIAETRVERAERLMEVVLALKPGGIVPFNTWLKAEADRLASPVDEESRNRILTETCKALLWFEGLLCIVEMEFAHDEVGVLPIREVDALIREGERIYQDVALTKDNVRLQYRRTAPNPDGTGRRHENR